MVFLEACNFFGTEEKELQLREDLPQEDGLHQFKQIAKFLEHRNKTDQNKFVCKYLNEKTSHL